MGIALGLIGLAFFCAAVIALAAGVTWTVVKLLPLKEKPKKPAAASTES